MISEEMMMLERLGIGGAAFVMVYFLLKKMQDRVFTLAENTIKENTAALMAMHEALGSHMRSKESLIEEIRECRHDRDDALRRIEEKIGAK